MLVGAAPLSFPIAWIHRAAPGRRRPTAVRSRSTSNYPPMRSEEHTSELQSLMRTSYAVYCLKKKKLQHHNITSRNNITSQAMAPHTITETTSNDLCTIRN